MKNKEQKLLEQAEKNGLFNDIICDDCDRTFDINWRNCIVDSKRGLPYQCPFCGSFDILGWDVIEETAKQKLN